MYRVLVLIGCSVFMTGCFGQIMDFISGSGGQQVADGLSATGNPALMVGGLAITLVGSLIKNLRDGFAIRGVIKGVQDGLDAMPEADKEKALGFISSKMSRKSKAVVTKNKRVLVKAGA